MAKKLLKFVRYLSKKGGLEFIGKVGFSTIREDKGDSRAWNYLETFSAYEVETIKGEFKIHISKRIFEEAYSIMHKYNTLCLEYGYSEASGDPVAVLSGTNCGSYRESYIYRVREFFEEWEEKDSFETKALTLNETRQREAALNEIRKLEELLKEMMDEGEE